MQQLQRVLIVDSHVLVASGLRTLLAYEPDIEVLPESAGVGESAGAEGALTPHLLLMDRTTPHCNDAEAVLEIKLRYPQARVLMLVPHANERCTLESLRAGANGYIRIDASREELRAAIRSVLQGRTYLDASASAELVGAYLEGRQSSAEGARVVLTPRERDVLKLVAAGKTSKHIAECLSLSVKTVGKHRSNLMAKLDLHNSAALTAYALGHGMQFG